MTTSPADIPGRTQWWKDQLVPADIPVLRATLDALAGWRAMAERADANSLADTILRDPLMTLNLLIHVSQRFGARLATPVETVTAALVLLGIEPFFNQFGELKALEDELSSTPHALFASLHAIKRAHHAARLAAAFAIERQDGHAAWRGLGAAHEFRLPPHGAQVHVASHLGIGLAGQVDLDGRIDRHQPLAGPHGLGIEITNVSQALFNQLNGPSVDLIKVV